MGWWRHIRGGGGRQRNMSGGGGVVHGFGE